jgi:hypothetical protein
LLKTHGFHSSRMWSTVVVHSLFIINSLKLSTDRILHYINFVSFSCTSSALLLTSCAVRLVKCDAVTKTTLWIASRP